MTIKFIKNADTVSHTWAGQSIAPAAYYQIQAVEMVSWSTNAQLLADIGAGLAVVARSDDGTTDMGISDGIDWLKDADPSPRDTDGSPIQRNKYTKTGWHYEPRSLDFTTGVYKSLYNRKHDGNTIADGTDYGDATLKFYTSAGDELTFQETGHESETEEQFQTRLDSDCVKTIMAWQPTHDMDIIGGILMIKDAPTADTYMWTIVAPDIPENLGGSVPHVAGGWNLAYFNSKDKIQVNGRGSKTVVYDPVYNSNKFGTIIKHAAGTNVGVQMVYEFFKG